MVDRDSLANLAIANTTKAIAIFMTAMPRATRHILVQLRLLSERRTRRNAGTRMRICRVARGLISIGVRHCTIAPQMTNKKIGPRTTQRISSGLNGCRFHSLMHKTAVQLPQVPRSPYEEYAVQGILPYLHCSYRQ